MSSVWNGAFLGSLGRESSSVEDVAHAEDVTQQVADVTPNATIVAESDSVGVTVTENTSVDASETSESDETETVETIENVTEDATEAFESSEELVSNETVESVVESAESSAPEVSSDAPTGEQNG